MIFDPAKHADRTLYTNWLTGKGRADQECCARLRRWGETDKATHISGTLLRFEPFPGPDGQSALRPTLKIGVERLPNSVDGFNDMVGELFKAWDRGMNGHAGPNVFDPERQYDQALYDRLLEGGDPVAEAEAVGRVIAWASRVNLRLWCHPDDALEIQGTLAEGLSRYPRGKLELPPSIPRFNRIAHGAKLNKRIDHFRTMHAWTDIERQPAIEFLEHLLPMARDLKEAEMSRSPTATTHGVCTKHAVCLFALGIDLFTVVEQVMSKQATKVVAFTTLFDEVMRALGVHYHEMHAYLEGGSRVVNRVRAGVANVDSPRASSVRWGASRFKAWIREFKPPPIFTAGASATPANQLDLAQLLGALSEIESRVSPHIASVIKTWCEVYGTEDAAAQRQGRSIRDEFTERRRVVALLWRVLGHPDVDKILKDERYTPPDVGRINIQEAIHDLGELSGGLKGCFPRRKASTAVLRDILGVLRNFKAEGYEYFYKHDYEIWEACIEGFEQRSAQRKSDGSFNRKPAVKSEQEPADKTVRNLMDKNNQRLREDLLSEVYISQEGIPRSSSRDVQLSKSLRGADWVLTFIGTGRAGSEDRADDANEIRVNSNE